MPKPTRAHYGEFHPTRLSQNGKFPLMMCSNSDSDRGVFFSKNTLPMPFGTS
jgi:hypothetical protein